MFYLCNKIIYLPYKLFESRRTSLFKDMQYWVVQFQYTYMYFCSGPKNLKIFVIMGLRIIKFVEKPSNLVHFDYFSIKAWFFSKMCLNF